MLDRRSFSATLARAAFSLLNRIARRAAPSSVQRAKSRSVTGLCRRSLVDVIVLLQAAGSATAVQNPLTSLADDVAATQRILALQTA